MCSGRKESGREGKVLKATYIKLEEIFMIKIIFIVVRDHGATEGNENALCFPLHTLIKLAGNPRIDLLTMSMAETVNDDMAELKVLTTLQWHKVDITVSYEHNITV